MSNHALELVNTVPLLTKPTDLLGKIVTGCHTSLTGVIYLLLDARTMACFPPPPGEEAYLERNVRIADALNAYRTLGLITQHQIDAAYQKDRNSNDNDPLD